MPHYTTWDSRRFDFQGTEASVGDEIDVFKSPGSEQELRQGIMQSVEPVLENAIVEDPPMTEDWVLG